MGNPITHPENLMVFFSEWPLQMIYDFYEAECDLLGEAYCDDIESTYKHEDGVEIIKHYLQEYKDSFRFLLKECRCKNIPDSKDETEIAEWLLSEEHSEFLHKIMVALSKGFIFEWIVYHHTNLKKQQFVEILCQVANSSEYDYDEWEYQFTRGRLTRIEMAKEFGLNENAVCYFYRRIIQGDCLRIVFHALNSNGRLNLAKHAEFINKGLRRCNLSYEVQIYYENLCKEFPSYNWNKGLRFVQDKKTAFCQVKFPKDENAENEKHEQFFIKKFLPYDGICGESKLLKRSELLELIKDVCSKWEEPKERKWKILWFYTFKFILDINLINPFGEEITEKERKRKPYARFVNLVIRYIHPNFNDNYADNFLGTYMDPKKKLPKLKDQSDYNQINNLFSEFKERITEFIQKSQTI